MEKRLIETIKIRKALRDLEIKEDSELYPELTNFFEILKKWTLTDEWSKGYIKVKGLKRKIIYDLREPDKTTVFLRTII